MALSTAILILTVCGSALAFTEGEEKAIKAMYSTDHFEGDMDLASTSRGFDKRVRKWPNGIVPYTMTNQFNSYQKNIINGAMQHIMQRTCIRFVPRSNQKSYINFNKNKEGCFAVIGMSSWPGQNVNLADDCLNYNKIGTAVHELLHALGFNHEHKRPDRDSYVQVLWDNIKWDAKGWFKSNFKGDTWDVTETSGTAYDTSSIMQYTTTTFSKDGRSPTLRSLTGAQLGQFDGLTPTDIYEVNKVYGCDMSRVPTNGVKFARGK